MLMAGDEGFEPPIMGPEPIALPLGQSPLDCMRRSYAFSHLCWQNGTHFVGLFFS